MAKSSPKRSLIAETKSAALARNTARLAALLAIIRRRMTEVVEAFYDIGEALREIVDHKLYAVAGHKSLKVFLAAEKLLSARQAMKLIAVVRRVPREQALTLGEQLIAHLGLAALGELGEVGVVALKGLELTGLRRVELLQAQLR